MELPAAAGAIPALHYSGLFNIANHHLKSYFCQILCQNSAFTWLTFQGQCLQVNLEEYGGARNEAQADPKELEAVSLPAEQLQPGCQNHCVMTMAGNDKAGVEKATTQYNEH